MNSLPKKSVTFASMVNIRHVFKLAEPFVGWVKGSVVDGVPTIVDKVGFGLSNEYFDSITSLEELADSFEDQSLLIWTNTYSSSKTSGAPIHVKWEKVQVSCSN